MTDDNHEQDTKKSKTDQLDRELQRRGVKIDDAIRGITDDDRRLLINKSLRKVHSALSVSWTWLMPSMKRQARTAACTHARTARHCGARADNNAARPRRPIQN